MSILIKGVEMPKSCGDCPCQQEEYGYCQVIEEEARFCDYKSRPEWCPLAPVPTPHGRLVDADALILALMDRGVDDIQTDDLHEISQTVWDAPTVVESEE